MAIKINESVVIALAALSINVSDTINVQDSPSYEVSSGAATLEINVSDKFELHETMTHPLAEDILTNGDMELDSNWTDYNSPTYNERSTIQVYENTYSRRIGGDSNQGARSDAMSIVSGRKYLIEGYAYVESGQFALYSFGSWSFTTKIISETGRWIYFKIVATASGATGGLEFNVNAAGTEYFIDKVSVKEYNDGAQNIICIPPFVPETGEDIFNADEAGSNGWTISGSQPYSIVEYSQPDKFAVHNGRFSFHLRDDGGNNSPKAISLYTGNRTTNWKRFYLYIPTPDIQPNASQFGTLFHTNMGHGIGFETDGSGNPFRWWIEGNNYDTHIYGNNVSTQGFALDKWIRIDLKVVDLGTSDPNSGIELYVDGVLAASKMDEIQPNGNTSVTYLEIGAGGGLLDNSTEYFKIYFDAYREGASIIGEYQHDGISDSIVINESVTVEIVATLSIDVSETINIQESITGSFDLKVGGDDTAGRLYWANAESGNIASENFDAYDTLIVSTDSKYHGDYGFKALYNGGGQNIYGRFNEADPYLTETVYFRCYVYISSDYTFQATTYKILEGVSSTWGGRASFGFICDGSGIPTSWRVNNAGSPNWANSSTNFSLDAWHCIEMIYNYGSSVSPDFYVDGVLCQLSQALGTTDETTTNLAYLFLGERSSRTGTNGCYIYFDSFVIDDERIGFYKDPVQDKIIINESVTVEIATGNPEINVSDQLTINESVTVEISALEINVSDQLEVSAAKSNLIPSASSTFETDGTAFWDGSCAWNSGGEYMEIPSGYAVHGFGDLGGVKYFRVSFRARSSTSTSIDVYFLNQPEKKYTATGVNSSWQNFDGTIPCAGGIFNDLYIIPNAGNTDIDDIVLREITYDLDLSASIDVSDQIIINESVNVQIAEEFGANVYDVLQISESATVFIPTLKIDVSDQLNISEAITGELISQVSVIETLYLSEDESIKFIFEIVSSESLAITDQPFLNVSSPLIDISDLISIAESAEAFLPFYLIDLSDQITINESASAFVASEFAANVNEILYLSETTTVFIPIYKIDVADILTIAESVEILTGSLAVDVSDTINISETTNAALGTIGALSLSVFDTIEISESNTQNAGSLEVDLIDLVNVSDAPTAQALEIGVISAIASDLLLISEYLNLTESDKEIDVSDPVYISELVKPVIVSKISKVETIYLSETYGLLEILNVETTDVIEIGEYYYHYSNEVQVFVVDLINILDRWQTPTPDERIFPVESEARIFYVLRDGDFTDLGAQSQLYLTSEGEIFYDANNEIFLLDAGDSLEASRIYKVKQETRVYNV